MKSSRILILTNLFLCLLSIITFTNSRAQNLDTITIGGRIVDENGDSIRGAEVSTTLTKTANRRSTISDAEGRYRLIQLPPGTYVIEVSSVGFAPQKRNGLSTLAGQTVVQDFTLHPQTVTVDPIVITSEQTNPIDTSRTVVGMTVARRDIDALPIATHSALDFVFILPGVTEEPLSTRDLAEDRDTIPANTPEEAGTFALAGAPAYSNNLTIDGLDNNDDRAARERFLPPLDAVDEVQVITNQFSAEYGRASGGRVNLRTRVGSSEFRGRSFYYFRDEALNANTSRNNALGLPRLPLQQHDQGFTLGGPVPTPGTESRTFFFVAYEHDRVLDSALVDTLVPIELNPLFPLPHPTERSLKRQEDVNEPALSAEIAPYIKSFSTPQKNTSFIARIDHQFAATHSASFVYQSGRLNNLRQFSGGNRLSEALQGQIRESDAISLSDDYVITGSLVNQARMQYSRLAPAVKASGGQAPVVLIAINDSLEANDPARRSGTLVAGSSTAGAAGRSEARFQFQEVLTSVKGNNSLTLGLDLHRIRSTFIDLADASGTFNFASAGDFLANKPSRFRQTFLGSSTQRNTYFGLFFQNQWRPSANLTIGYGVRYEREAIIRDVNNFGPRFSIAFDPFNSARTVVRFGFGVFYNRVLLRTIDDFTVGAKQLFFDTNALRDPLTRKLFTTDERRAFIAAHIQFPQTLSIDSSLVKEFGVLDSGFSRRLDPHLRIPESYQTNIGFEQYLGNDFTLESNVTVTRGVHLWREFNANAPKLPPGYATFSAFLMSRDFANFRPSANAIRPLYNASGAGELVRFVAAPAAQSGVTNVVEFGVPVSLINLNSFSSTTALDVARAALDAFRPDPGRAEIEQLISAGNSSYKGLTIELRRRASQATKGFLISFRAAYTYSRLFDDGIVNTSDALRPGDFAAERARSLLDRRHRFVFTGTFDLPPAFGRLQVAPMCRITSGAPFNISLGGIDRNLDDVGNDRPGFNGDLRFLRWRRPGETVSTDVLKLFTFPLIGQSGNLPRNAGTGPGQFFLDVKVTRDFRLSEKIRMRSSIEFDNVLNKNVFSFGSEFINFSAFSPGTSAERLQAFLESFLVPTRTLRARQIRLGVRFDF